MKLDRLEGEEGLSFYIGENGVWHVTNKRLIFEGEKWNPRFSIMEKQQPQIYMLKDLKKAEIKGETLTAQFKANGKAHIQLKSPEDLQIMKIQIEQAAEILRLTRIHSH